MVFPEPLFVSDYACGATRYILTIDIFFEGGKSG
jgi:hypothetical protein